ncbi:MAG: low temperature requirement protein A [Sphingomonadales bacterium]|nr:low temperature requirement protein A [Sphingomonadales bacterium]
MYLWALAILIEYAGPMVFFRMPVLGRSTGADWDISGGHMAERCALFIIIALGEAVLVTGATYSALPHDGPTTAAFVTSFVGSATLWWIYFDIGAKRASSMISSGQCRIHCAQRLYLSAHANRCRCCCDGRGRRQDACCPGLAVSDRVYLLTACGGPILFLFGNQMFKWVTSEQRFPPLSHFIGNFLLAMIAVAGYFAHWGTLTVGVLATSSLIFTAQWNGSFARRMAALGPVVGSAGWKPRSALEPARLDIGMSS